MRDSGKNFDDHLLTHLSPLGWEQINPTGDYIWRQSRYVEEVNLRLLGLAADA